MAIFKRDSINGQGEKLEGETIRLPYRMAGSITNGGKTYVFIGMEGGEAVYKLQEVALPPAQPVVIETPAGAPDTTPTIERSDLPAGALLNKDFVGGRWNFAGKAYRMMQPPTKCDGMYVFLPDPHP